MADANELKKAGATLIELRERYVRALARGYEKDQTEIWTEGIVHVQQAIKVVNELATEERRESGNAP